jgi:hypothetical protein
MIFWQSLPDLSKIAPAPMEHVIAVWPPFAQRSHKGENRFPLFGAML